MQQTYDNEVMSCPVCYEWHSRFRSGRTSLKDEERSGRPSTSTNPKIVDRVRQLVHEDHRESVQTILTSNFNMHLIVTKFVPRFLTLKQEYCAEVCQELRQHALNDPTFMSKIIKGDESWIWSSSPVLTRFSPSDFFLFLKIDLKLKGRWFDTENEIKCESQAVLCTLRNQDLQRAFQKFKKY